MKIEWVPTNSLVPNPKNRNKHPKEQIERLAKIIKANGWRHPIIVSNLSGQVVVGHGRLEAAKLLHEPKVPVHFQDFANKEEEFQFGIADNAIASWAELDLAGINADLPEMGPDLDLNLLGIKDFELEPADKYGDKDADDVPESRPTNIRLGELYQLGNHRLLCGDSTDRTMVERLMNGKKADMVFTSPPYNGATHLDYGKGRNKKLYANNSDDMPFDEYLALLHNSLNLCFEACEGFIFWNVNYNAKSRFAYLSGIYPRLAQLWETIIWKKTGMPLSNGLTRNCEFIFVFKNGERKHLSKEFQTETNHWEISNIGAQDIENHRACFPVALPQRAINISTEGNALVYEPFSGSGSTLIACEKTNRKCYGMEMDPQYCQVIIDRWEKFTGKKAVKISSGAT